MRLPEQRKGELYIALGNSLWAIFPVVVILSYSYLPSMHSLAWSTFFATITFSGIMTYRRKWNELRDLQVWKFGIYIALSIGVVFYGLYYIGLETTTAGNAAIIVLFEIFTTIAFFRLLNGEILPREHIGGTALMVLGACIVLGSGFTNSVHLGDFILLGATFVTPIGNYFQQEARRIASSETIMFLRSLLSLPFLFVIAYVWYPDIEGAAIRDSIAFLLVSGVVLLGISKIFWIEAIHRMTVSKAMALQSFTPFLTLIFAWFLLEQMPTLWQVSSLIPFVLGALLLTDHLHFGGPKGGLLDKVGTLRA